MPPPPSISPLRGLCCWQQLSAAPRIRRRYGPTPFPSILTCTAPRNVFQIRPRPFHSSIPLSAEPSNHYDTLGLTPDANGAEIKKQFYHLSKLHHPDHNPDDPSASTRFQRISAAYAVLGQPAKRQAYDRSLGVGHSGSAAPPSGSYSSSQRSSSPSSSSPFGARAASGLNKRRGTFRGPPPSFYASGGWGGQANKRRAAAQHGGHASSSMASHAEGSTAAGAADRRASSGSGAPGSSAGARAGGGGGMPGDEVPHFDRQRHFERQEEMDERMATRRRARREWEAREREAMQRDLGFKVILVTACVAGVWLIDVLFVSPWRGNRVENKKERR